MKITKMTESKFKNLLSILGGLKMIISNKKVRKGLVFVLILFLGIVFLRYTPLMKSLPLPGFVKSFTLSQSEDEKAKEQTKTLIAQVKKHMVIPDEEPVVATVTDASLLVKEQKFFEGAENGDMLLVFPKAAKAIIYSSKRDLVVNVGPLIAPTQANGTELQNPAPSIEPLPSADKTTSTKEPAVKPTTSEVKQ